MKKTGLLLMCLLASTTLFITSAQADWAYRFVVNEGKIYIVSDDKIDIEQIDSAIGRVTSYSDQEGTYSGNFSNYYPEGTEYYNIRGVSLKEAIAIKISEESFIKADYGGLYGGSRLNWVEVLPFVIGLILLVIIVFIVNRQITLANK